jgi:hypothetical protein
MDIEETILVIVMPILISFIYIFLVSGFLSDVFISRLTKASFEIAPRNIIDLWFGYFLGMLVFSYIVHQFVKYTALDIDSSSEILVVIIGLTFLYLGRIVTKNKGIFYGRLHFSSLFILGSLFFVLNSLIMWINLSGGGGQYITSFLDRITSTLIFMQSSIKPIFIGTIILSTVGELGLYHQQHKHPRSLLAVSEKFPSDFMVITGKKGIREQSNQMFGKNKDIKSMKCVTKSCTMVKDIEGAIRQIYKEQREKKGKKEIRLNYKIIKAPTDRAIEDFENAVNNLPLSMEWLFKKSMIKNYVSNLLKRNVILNRLITEGMVEAKEFNFGELRFLIVEDSRGCKKLLVSARDRGPLMDRVGLYSEEPYIVESFANLFDTKWSSV